MIHFLPAFKDFMILDHLKNVRRKIFLFHIRVFKHFLCMIIDDYKAPFFDRQSIGCLHLRRC